ncbi:nucleoside 2-deoxyribosyltransferase [Streptomyces sp. NBC_00243]|uniref:hypothetical protein n=1 Tax=Streptomyces sp. NBC_00243 TaxID=2975688 RepID=UPI002DDB0288|nr:hypothetical protein [Streptomyces sp. NBC_00243]WRZ25063.1 nucleoside 2-deoxyribosyltransferase [Streptomyces sp. NBC_00243]
MNRYIYSIMPVSSDEDYYAKRASLSSVAEEFSLTVHFPLDRGLPETGKEFDLARVVREVEQAAMVIADLSLERPSCYYELGLVQAIGTQVALIARSGTNIHQAFGRNSVKEFRNLQEYPSTVRQILLDARIES